MSFKNETVVETKSCQKCQISFDITDKDLEFYDKVSPVFEGEKYNIPSPKFCPDCRQQRRLAFRNERVLYKRKCDATDKEIISMYSPDKHYVVYESGFWWGDEWSAEIYGSEINFSASMLSQISKLIDNVPKINLSTEVQENSDYTNYAGWNKDCYLIFLGADNHNCYFCNGVWASKNTLESSYSTALENCYNIINSISVAHSSFGEVLQDCNHCMFCFDIKGKQYHILNKQYIKDEYEKIRKSLSDRKTLNIYLEKFQELKKQIIYRHNYNLYSENVEGEYIIQSSSVMHGYDVVGMQDSKYVNWMFHSKDCYDVYDWGDQSNSLYEGHKIGDHASNVIFSAFCLSNVSYLIYCYDCVNNCSNCFGCVGLKNKQYCILNKQYTKDEYNKLVPQIIEKMQQDGEWGEFFPSSISPFGYNETVANEYFPLDKKEVKQQGFNWSDYEAPFPEVEKTISADKIPDNIIDIPDDILNGAIICELTGRPFKIIKAELEFYRKHNLPIPRRHPDQRHLDRMKLRNPRKLFERDCDKCGVKMSTTYASDRVEKVYCEDCYNKEIY